MSKKKVEGYLGWSEVQEYFSKNQESYSKEDQDHLQLLLAEGEYLLERTPEDALWDQKTYLNLKAEIEEKLWPSAVWKKTA